MSQIAWRTTALRGHPSVRCEEHSIRSRFVRVERIRGFVCLKPQFSPPQVNTHALAIICARLRSGTFVSPPFVRVRGYTSRRDSSRLVPDHDELCGSLNGVAALCVHLCMSDTYTTPIVWPVDV